MAWDETTRDMYRRSSARYESDLTDEEWFFIEPLLPPPAKLGRRRTADLREICNAIPQPLEPLSPRQHPGAKQDQPVGALLPCLLRIHRRAREALVRRIREKARKRLDVLRAYLAPTATFRCVISYSLISGTIAA